MTNPPRQGTNKYQIPLSPLSHIRQYRFRDFHGTKDVSFELFSKVFSSKGFLGPNADVGCVVDEDVDVAVDCDCGCDCGIDAGL